MTILCDANGIEESKAIGIEVDGHRLVAVKKDGQVYVYVNSCPHIGIDLEFQPNQFLDLEGQFIQCANHGALFDIATGDCLSGPCSGQALKPVPTEVRDNKIVITGKIPERY